MALRLVALRLVASRIRPMYKQQGKKFHDFYFYCVSPHYVCLLSLGCRRQCDQSAIETAGASHTFLSITVDKHIAKQSIEVVCIIYNYYENVKTLFFLACSLIQSLSLSLSLSLSIYLCLYHSWSLSPSFTVPGLHFLLFPQSCLKHRNT